MKVQNELKEILRQAFNAGWWYRDSKEIYPNVDDWMEQNQSKILASVEPEPLAKNKDSESKCLCEKPFILIYTKPNSCGNCGKII